MSVDSVEKIDSFVGEYESYKRQLGTRLVPGEVVDDDIPIMFLGGPEITSCDLTIKNCDWTKIRGRKIRGKSTSVAFTRDPEAAYWMIFRRQLTKSDHLYITTVCDVRDSGFLVVHQPAQWRPLHLAYFPTEFLQQPYLEDVPQTRKIKLLELLNNSRVS